MSLPNMPSNTVAFKNGSLTFCDEENPHWHIDATRIWLLPGGEFAFFNALLYVGGREIGRASCRERV